jgi:hypothetical protein
MALIQAVVGVQQHRISIQTVVVASTARCLSILKVVGGFEQHIYFHCIYTFVEDSTTHLPYIQTVVVDSTA